MSDEVEDTNPVEMDSTDENVPLDDVEVTGEQDDSVATGDDADDAGSEDDTIEQSPEAPPAPPVALIYKAAQSGLSDVEINEALKAGGVPALEWAVNAFGSRNQRNSGSQSTQAAKELARLEALAEFGEDFDPKLTKPLSSVYGHVQKMQDHYEGVISQLTQQLQHGSGLSDRREFDRAIRSLEGGEKLFGKGRGYKFDNGSQEMSNRSKLWDAATRLQSLAQSQGKFLDIDDAVEDAYRIEFKNHVDTQKRAALTSSVKQFSGQGLRKPESRKEEVASADQKFLAAAKAFRQTQAKKKASIRK